VRPLSSIAFPDVKHIYEAHAEALRVGGGTPGVRDAGLIDSATMNPRHHPKSLAHAASTLAFSLAKNHGFVDGNKRVAFYAARAFLVSNGVAPIFDESYWYNVIIAVADGRMGRDELTECFAHAMGGDPIEIDLSA